MLLGGATRCAGGGGGHFNLGAGVKVLNKGAKAVQVVRGEAGNDKQSERQGS